MTLRADHAAGSAFVAFGALVIALSSDLPTGQLSMPGAGFLPKIVATLTIVFGLMLILRAGESAPFVSLGWSDGKHAVMVCLITAVAIFLYTQLGFIITMGAMIVTLLVIIERRNPLYAAGYSAGIVLLTYLCFETVLKTPLPEAPFRF